MPLEHTEVMLARQFIFFLIPLSLPKNTEGLKKKIILFVFELLNEPA